MKSTIIYDNESHKKGLKPDWGFACLVEAFGRKMLFDTGAKGSMLLDNMKKLGIEPASIDEVFISHYHWDHTGGLTDFLDLNPVRVYIPSSCPEPQNAGEVIKVEEAFRLHEGIFSTGELKGIEQSLLIETERGLVVIAGCSHPGVSSILEAASQFGKPYALIGGLHGFNEFELVKDLELICPTHCTQFISEIESVYPDKFMSGGAGEIIII
ncbi:MAG: MBL fold metallo-hydrolase [Candidatus Hatepunaea meridiana]|nr:MBL fold metallo-hydrolase [Candidatus Hatepunaea meridiana]